MMLGNFIRVVASFSLALACSLGAMAVEQDSVDALLSESSRYLYSTPEKTVLPLAKLQVLQSTFTQAQREKYHHIYASSLGYRGRHEERIALVQSFIGQVKTPGLRASFLYELIDGSTALGQYEKALQAMNESILLLPVLTATG
ncbi:MAG: hypothetical protein Q8R49_02975, partial [Rhodoferax sp.]|nr:hypothetical protein [Rhodoferax sp.]